MLNSARALKTAADAHLPKVLSAAGLVRSQGSFSLFCDHLILRPGQCVAITGPSGSGKSTLLALLALALEPDSGTLMLAGTDTIPLWRTPDSLAALRSRSLGFVPQNGALLPYLTVQQNIGLPLAILGAPDPARVNAIAEQLGIAAILGRRPGAISVGQRQRAAIARALIHRPALILADEPTAAVHPAQADEILALLAAAANDGAAVLIATHDAARAEAGGFTLAPAQPEPHSRTRFAFP